MRGSSWEASGSREPRQRGGGCQGGPSLVQGLSCRVLQERATPCLRGGVKGWKGKSCRGQQPAAAQVEAEASESVWASGFGGRRC